MYYIIFLDCEISIHSFIAHWSKSLEFEHLNKHWDIKINSLFYSHKHISFTRHNCWRFNESRETLTANWTMRAVKVKLLESKQAVWSNAKKVLNKTMNSFANTAARCKKQCQLAYLPRNKGAWWRLWEQISLWLKFFQPEKPGVSVKVTPHQLPEVEKMRKSSRNALKQFGIHKYITPRH